MKSVWAVRKPLKKHTERTTRLGVNATSRFLPAGDQWVSRCPTLNIGIPETVGSNQVSQTSTDQGLHAAVESAILLAFDRH